MDIETESHSTDTQPYNNTTSNLPIHAWQIIAFYGEQVYSRPQENCIIWSGLSKAA